MASGDEAPVARLADTLCGRFDGETESLSGSDLDDAARRSPVDERTDRRRLLAAARRPSVLQREQDWEDMKTHPWRPHERVSIASAIRQSFTGAQGFMESTEKILGAKGGLKRKKHRNQVARDLIARLDDCYLRVESIADASSTSPHRRAPPSFEDVGTFPFKLHAPDADEYPIKAPKPYMELYGDRWWFVKLFAHPQVVTRLLRQLWPHLFVVALFQLGINGLTALDVDPPVSVLRELEATQHLLGAVLSLLLVFRTNSAYERYYDGKKQYGIIANQVRQIIMNAYAFISFHEDPTGRLRQRYGRGLELDDEHEAESLHELRERVRRQAIVLFAVLRQDLRERRCGFVPSSTLKHVPFTRHTWILDPSRPRLVDLLTPREIVDFGRVSSGSRVMLACHNLMDALQRLAPRIAQDKPFTDACTRNVQDLIDAAKSCQRIVDTPLPFTYTLILGVLLFITVTGHSPYKGKTHNDMLRAIMRARLPTTAPGWAELCYAREQVVEDEEGLRVLEALPRVLPANGGHEWRADRPPRVRRVRGVRRVEQLAPAGALVDALCYGLARQEPRVHLPGSTRVRRQQRPCGGMARGRAAAFEALAAQGRAAFEARCCSLTAPMSSAIGPLPPPPPRRCCHSLAKVRSRADRHLRRRRRR